MEDSSLSSCYGIDNNTTMIGIEQFKQIAKEIIGNAFKSSSSSSPLPLKSLMEKIEEDLVIRIALQDLLSSQQLSQTEQDVKDQVCNQAYKFVNQHLLLMIEKLQKDGVASISTVDQEEFLNQYITFMFRVEPSDINYKMNFNEKPSQRKILQKVTPAEVLDKTTLAIEKAMRDINPERMKQMLDKKRDTDASETFEESMRTFEMLNQEESSALRKLAFALGYLKINEPNDEKYIQKVNNIFKNLGLQVELALPQEILSKPPQGGGSKKSSKSHSKSKSKSVSIKQTWGAWKASGGVSDPAQQIIDRILNAKLQDLFEKKINELKQTWENTVSQKTQELFNDTVKTNIDKADEVTKAIDEFKFIPDDGSKQVLKGKAAIDAYLAYIQTKGEEVNNLAEAKKATIAAVKVPEVPDVTAKLANLTENIDIIDNINTILHPTSEGGSTGSTQPPEGLLQQVQALTALKDEISVALNAIETALEDGAAPAEAHGGLKSRVQDLTATLANLEARLKTANNNLVKGEGESATGIEPDIQNIQQRIAEISAKIGNAKISSVDDSKSLTDQLLELQGILAGKGAEIGAKIDVQIGEIIAEKSKKLQAFEQQIVDLQKQITNSDGNAPGLTETLNELQKKSAGLTETIDTITNLLNSIKYTSQDGEDKSKVEAVEALQKDFGALNAKMVPLRDSASAAETAAREATENAIAAAAKAKAAEAAAENAAVVAKAMEGTVAKKSAEIGDTMRSIDAGIVAAKNDLTGKKDEILRELETAKTTALSEIKPKLEQKVNSATIPEILAGANVTPDSIVKIIQQKIETAKTGGTLENILREYANPMTDTDFKNFLSRLTKIESSPRYITDIINYIQAPENRLYMSATTLPGIVNNVLEIYTSLSLYKDILQDKPLTEVISTIFTQIDTEIDDLLKITTLDEDVIKQLKKYKGTKSIPPPPETPETPATGIQVFIEKKIDGYESFKNELPNAMKSLQEYYNLKDKAFPVRIVMNFSKRVASEKMDGSKLVEQTAVDGNYTNSKIINNPKMIQSLISDTSKQQYGPYYLVTDTSSTEYNVEQDIEQLFPKTTATTTGKPHIVYSAYGFSGAGKSYTLVQSANPNNILARVLKALNAKNKNKTETDTTETDTTKTVTKTDDTTETNESISIKYRIYDYYGEIDDDNCITQYPDKGLQIYNTPSTTIPRITQQTGGAGQRILKTTYYPKDNNSEFTNNIELTNAQAEIAGKIVEFENVRSKNMADATNELLEYHIRYTPNNPVSSRSHLFVDIDVYKGRNNIGRITLLDMAGSENVDTIQRIYFEKVHTDWEIDAIKTTLTVIPNTISALTTQFTTFASKLTYLNAYNDNQKIPLNNITNIKVSTLELKPIYTNINQGNFINTQSWKQLAEKIELPPYPPSSDKDDMLRFSINYNLYKYYLLVSPIYTFIRKLKDDIFNPLSYTIPKGTNPTTHTYTIWISKREEISYNSSNCTVNIETIKVILGNIGIDITDTTIKSYLEYLTNFNLYDALYSKATGAVKFKDVFKNNCVAIASIIINKINEILEQIVNALKKEQSIKTTIDGKEKEIKLLPYLDLLKKYQDDIKKNFPPEKHADIFTKNLNILYTNEKLFLTKQVRNGKDQDIPFISTLQHDVDNWTAKYLKKIHCPLRYQGNFIMKTLDEMKGYLTALQKGSTRADLFPGNILQSSSGDKLKFILFTNVRLDFDSVGNQEETVNINLKDAYKRSIEFSDSINPLATTVRGLTMTPPSPAGGSIYQEGGAGKEKGADPVPSAPPAPGAPGVVMDPVAAIANAKEKLGELSDIKRDLNASITTFENMQTKVARFKSFQTKVKEIEVGSEDKKNENEIIGAYNYMKEEGVVIKEEFKKTIDAQKKSLKTLQNKISKILQSEPQTPNILRLLGKLIEIMEEKSSSKDSRGVYNDISAFYTSFEDIFNEAFSEAKRKASAIQEQRKISAEAQARGYGNPFGYFQQQQDRDRKREKEPDTRQQADNKPVAVNPAEPKAPPAKPENPPAKPEEPAAAAPARVGGKSPQEGGVVGVGSSDKTISESEENTGKIPQMEEPDKLLSITKGLKQVLDEVVGELIKMYQRRTNPAMSVFSSDSMFSRILNDYLSNRNETNEAEMRDRFMNQLEANDLVPRKVLAITQMDKIVFIFVTLFLRILCVSIITSLIERGVVKNMQWAVTGYLILYTLILIGFVAIVNLDMYRMRIVFNYINFHANAGKLYMHLGLLYILGILIYIIMTRVNLPVRNVSPKVISDNEKLRLIMRFQILTGILWFVLALVIMISSE